MLAGSVKLRKCVEISITSWGCVFGIEIGNNERGVIGDFTTISDTRKSMMGNNFSDSKLQLHWGTDDWLIMWGTVVTIAV